MAQRRGFDLWKMQNGIFHVSITSNTVNEKHEVTENPDCRKISEGGSNPPRQINIGQALELHQLKNVGAEEGI
jgi:hypothetical protein